MKIATWNVAYGRGKANAFRIEKIREINADIWVLTETHDSLDLREDFDPFRTESRVKGANRSLDSYSRWVTIWAKKDLKPVKLETDDKYRTSACAVQFGDQKLVVFGTVLPWYTDTERLSYAEELENQADDWGRLRDENGGLLCVAGDFNLNLGGPHYYGSAVNKVKMLTTLERSQLVACTCFCRTQTHDENREFGLIDHLAISQSLETRARIDSIWPKGDEKNRILSDHEGVAITVD